MTTHPKTFHAVNEILSEYVPHKRSQRETYSLDTIRSLMTHLGNPQDKIRVIHIAGTSGKTSTSYFIASLLHASGQKVGMTVSPHIVEVNERVQIGLIPLEEQIFCAYFGKFLAIIKSFKQQITYFELLMAFAYWVFEKEKVDFAVIETGLGGRMDGSNVVNSPNKICVITDIGLDHTEILGDTLEAIAAEKAGIITPKNHVIVQSQLQEVLDIFIKVAKSQKASLEIATALLDLPAHMPPFQKHNFSLAYATYFYICKLHSTDIIDVPTRNRIAGQVVLGRAETFVIDGKTLVLDGAHNMQKMEAFGDFLKERFGKEPMHALIALKSTKDVETLKTLFELVNGVIITEYNVTQDFPIFSLPASEVQSYAVEYKLPFEIQIDTQKALAALLKRPEKVLIITGSLYLVSIIRKLLLRND